jgi:hypothetical protein
VVVQYASLIYWILRKENNSHPQKEKKRKENNSILFPYVLLSMFIGVDRNTSHGTWTLVTVEETEMRESPFWTV